MKLEVLNIYCMDTSALVTIQRYYPIELFSDLWKNLEVLFSNHRIISHDFVYDEIVPKTGTKDELANLVSKNKKYFKQITKGQAQLVPEIILLFPNLIDPKAKKNEADPWLIALVIDEMELKGIFGEESEFVIVSNESKKNPNKIPAVCKHYNVRHMSLFEFFEDNGWKFAIKSN